MRLDRFEIINEEFTASAITQSQLDRLLADGWRHFGPHFFRYNFGVYENELRRVIPLRIRVEDFAPSKSQRRAIRRNADLETIVQPILLTEETHQLFGRHKARFTSGVPDSLYDFLPRGPSESPTTILEVSVSKSERLVAASYFDVGETSISSIYGIFDPKETARSLGIFTMLVEIKFAREQGHTLYYHGYAYEGQSYYDYKKRFGAMERFDWAGNWSEFDADA
ncbi:MAG: arginine-tRNA-protein transferase [Acidobacteriota bacterium]